MTLNCFPVTSEQTNNTKVEELEKEVISLKEEMNKLKLEMVTKMDKILEMLEIEKEVEDIDMEGLSYQESKKGKEVTKENDNKKNKEQTFKCDECEYECKRKPTLKKHMNTKHGNAANREEKKDKSKNKVKETELAELKDGSENKTEIERTEKEETNEVDKETLIDG